MPLLTLLSLLNLQSAPDIEKHFRPFEQGWIGGDGIYSVPLGDDKTLWLFGDTFIGRIQNQRRLDAQMIHNTVAIEHQGQWQYHWKKNPLKDVFISPNSGRWFWPGPGLYHKKQLYLLLPEFTTAPGAEGFGFKQSGLYLARIDHPEEPLEKWRPHYQKLNWGLQGSSYSVAALKDKAHWYIYGYRDHAGQREAHLMRLPLGQMIQSTPEYWGLNGWSHNPYESEPLFQGYQSEGSVHRDPESGKLQMVYTAPGLSDRVVMRSADQPQGPWSLPQTVFRYPEMQDKRYFCYAAKHHPHLSQSGEWVIGYACNGFKFQDVMNNAKVYIPRFVKVRP